MTQKKLALLPVSLVLAACLTFILAAQPALCQPAAEARQALAQAVSLIMDDIKSPTYANPATRSEARAKIEKEVYRIFDFSEFSSRTVGQRWRSFSANEKKSFEDAFANLLFNTYLNKVTGYNGEQVAYTGETVSPKGDIVEVHTTITLDDNKKIPVNYRMLSKDGQWRVFDVIIENISLVRNYRTQFQDILKSAPPSELIERINQKAREVIAQGAGAK